MEKSKKATIDGVLIEVLQDATSTARAKEKAFNDLYSRHSQQVLIYFLKNTNDTEVAEDLRVITFEKVFESIQNYDVKKAAFSTWMYKVAKNTLIDSARRDKFEVLSLDALSGKTSEENDGMDFQLKSDSLDPEQVMVREQNIKEVRVAIASLENSLMKELMTKRFIDDMTFDEIAKEMGVKNNSTLRVNIKRGKKEVFKILSK